jgi:hypothetical protein
VSGAALILSMVRVLAAGVLLLAPGYLLWERAARGIKLPPLVSVALWLALSCSILSLLFLWASTLGLSLMPSVLRLMLIGFGLLAAWHVARHRPRLRWQRWPIPMLFLLATMALGLRLYQIRGVVLPLWVDSVHHALLIRVVAETGRIPTSLRPYMPIDHLPYHWGYHVIAATWQAATWLPLPALMLLGGQVLNALNVLTVYALAAYLSRSPLAGTVAALATGFLSIMPAYFVTWGRYTQLAGLLVVPGLLIVASLLIERSRLQLPLLFCTSVILAGLILIHYRVLVFFAAAMLPYLLLFGLRFPRRLPGALMRLALAGALSLLLAAPWLLVLGREVFLPAAQAPASLLGGGSYNELERGLLFTRNSRWLYGVAAAGAFLALLRARWRLVAIAAWIGLLFLIANLQVIGLRPLWLITNHAVIISLFLPVSVLLGEAAAYVVHLLRRWSPARLGRAIRLLPGIVLLLLAAHGIWQFRNVINPRTNLSTPADLPALAWVAEHTPPDARFLINTGNWLGDVPRGTDAGWWIMPLTGRWTSTPPVIFDYGAPEDVATVIARTADIARLRPEQISELDALVHEHQIDYVFIGAKGGPLKGDMFWGRSEYENVYDQDGVLIFKVLRR